MINTDRLSRNSGEAGSILRIQGTQSVATRAALRAALVCGFCLLTWAGALIRVPIPGTPVPMTLQTIPVLLSGALLGPAGGGASQALYLLVGLSGAPAFSGGTSGFAHLAGPTGGYLVGFFLGASLVGWLVRRRRDPGLGYLVLSVLAGSVVIFAAGIAHLALFLGGNLASAALQGAVIFLPWDILKVAAVAATARLLRPIRSPLS